MGGFMRTQIRGVIIEGLSHAGKTSTLKALKRLRSQDNEAERSVVILREHYSKVLNNINRKFERLNREEHLQLLSDRVDMLEKLNDWASSLGITSRRSRGLFLFWKGFI